ncbi:MAG TPA: hypothetical protein VI548_03770, partial [Chitinophagaceae bacterium]|nr:hypothetical protein [Chitinophagaceae bacterium]
MSKEKDYYYILWLPSWYPCKLTPYDGDFIQRHARAVSAFVSVQVVHFIRDKDGTVTKDIRIEENKTDKLTETIVYYYSKTLPVQAAD